MIFMLDTHQRKSYSVHYGMLEYVESIMKKGRIFNIEKYAIHDGPGIRTTVFFKGCPLRCLWCHNPEGQNPKSELIYREGRCIGCGECVKKCPRKALSASSDRVALNRKNCNVCGVCVQVCPSEALSIAGKEMSVEEVVKEIERDMAFYEESEGGVTFSGGEPLLQPDFLEALLHECSDRGIHTTLDTSGYALQSVIARVRDKVDLFLFDIKSMDEAKHKKYTGVSNRLVLRNLQRLVKDGFEVAVFMPIIPGVNDDEENIRRTGEFISSLQNVEYVSLLPYHNAGVDKYKNMGRTYNFKKLQSPSGQKMSMIRKNLEAFGLKVRIGRR
jgi:pyruvate formate lyase activating enzyme